jgi:hypothetical protein
MARRKEEERYDLILARIRNLRLPLLTLDQKWYRLFSKKKPKTIAETEKNLNEAVKRQGKIREEKSKLNSLKKTLMQDIVQNMNAPEGTKEFKKLEKSRDFIQEINDKIVLLENEELDLPTEIREQNAQLAMDTMEIFYEGISDDLEEIVELERWIKETREELKQKTELYDKKIRQTKNVTDYFDNLLGTDITHMYVNYLNGIYDDDDYE